MKRQPIVVANWKMNKFPSEAQDYISSLGPKLADYTNVDIVLAGQDVLLSTMVKAASTTMIQIAAENVYWEDRGAYTGETSPAALADLGIEYVIIGHSERRHYFRETDEMVNLKVLAALRNGLKPIIAIDENIILESQDDHTHWIVNQVVESLKGIAQDEAASILIAYEPTQAIGSGQAMNPQIVQTSLSMLRATLMDMYGYDLANQIRILYGGSVKPTNAYDLLCQPDIDGILVGNAALDPNTFLELIQLADMSRT